MSTSLVQVIDQRTPLFTARFPFTQPLRTLNLAIVTGIGFVMMIAGILLLIVGVFGGDLAFIHTPMWLIALRLFMLLEGCAVLVMGFAGLASALVEVVAKMLAESRTSTTR